VDYDLFQIDFFGVMGPNYTLNV